MRTVLVAAVALIHYTLAANGEVATKPDHSALKTGLAVHGINPQLAERYQIVQDSKSKEPLFRCLDPNGTLIPFKAVNDDFCDCPDGSDEPGTSACSYKNERRFWCKNEGHISAWIWSSRVGDGICDPECCDGSDENFSPSGVRCPNTCVETGRKHREKTEAENKIRKTGSKIRSTYITFAKNERSRLEKRVQELTKEVETKKDQVEAARVRLDRLESSDKEELDRRQASPLYASFLQHRKALTVLREQLRQVEEEKEELKSMLQTLQEGYNPNYQDMAVKAAVVGFTEKYAAKTESDASNDTPAAESSQIDEIDFDELERIDLVGLLMADGSDEEGDNDEEDTLLYRLDQYVPDAFYEMYEVIRDGLITYLIKFGVIGGNTASTLNKLDSSHTAEARKAFEDVSSNLKNLERDLDTARGSIDRLAGGFGPDAEWKKLEGTCIEKEQGDYTYSLCFFGQASQKSNRDGAKHSLGTFADWNAGEGHLPNTVEYYSKQLYNKGLKCWNGPERSVKVDLSCGVANELLHISEPEKCEYYFKATTPALCWPDSTRSGAVTEGESSAQVDASHQEL